MYLSRNMHKTGVEPLAPRVIEMETGLFLEEFGSLPALIALIPKNDQKILFQGNRVSKCHILFYRHSIVQKVMMQKGVEYFQSTLTDESPVWLQKDSHLSQHFTFRLGVSGDHKHSQTYRCQRRTGRFCRSETLQENLQ